MQFGTKTCVKHQSINLYLKSGKSPCTNTRTHRQKISVVILVRHCVFRTVFINTVYFVFDKHWLTFKCSAYNRILSFLCEASCFVWTVSLAWLRSRLFRSVLSVSAIILIGLQPDQFTLKTCFWRQYLEAIRLQTGRLSSFDCESVTVPSAIFDLSISSHKR